MLFLIHLIGGFYCATKLSIFEDNELGRLLLCVVLGWVFIIIYVFSYNQSSSSTNKQAAGTRSTEFVNTGNKNNYNDNNESNKHSIAVTKKNETIEYKPHEYSSEKSKTSSYNNNSNKSQNSNMFKGESLNSIYTSVAGVTYNDRQKYVRQCYTGQHLKVIRDVFNAYDENAIALYANGSQVGFIRKELATQLSKKIDSGIKFDCVVESVTGGNNNYYGLNIKLSEIKNNEDYDIGKVNGNNTSTIQNNKDNYYFGNNYDDFDEDDQEIENLDEVWTARDFNEYYTGDRDNDNWEYPDN